MQRFGVVWQQLRLSSHLPLLAAALVLVSCRSGSNRPAPAVQQPDQPVAEAPPPQTQVPVKTETQVEMVNVNLHLDPELVLHIRHLEGQFLPTRKGQPPSFDDKLS